MNEDILIHSSGLAEWRGKSYRCALGKGGVTQDKKEGDGATPAGRFPLQQVFVRSDIVQNLRTKLPVREIQKNDGWCDDPADLNYNRLVALPYAAQAESLWKDDDTYAIVVVIGYNDDPPVPGKGSAIFMHVARDGYPPTEGCIAFSKTDLLDILETITPDTYISIE